VFKLGGVKAAVKITFAFIFPDRKQEYKGNYIVNDGIQSACLIFVLFVVTQSAF
jgi:hypothetical protein